MSAGWALNGRTGVLAKAVSHRRAPAAELSSGPRRCRVSAQLCSTAASLHRASAGLCLAATVATYLVVSRTSPRPSFCAAFSLACVREFENMLGCHLHEWRRLTCENDFMSLHAPPTRPIPRRAAMKIAIVATSAKHVSLGVARRVRVYPFARAASPEERKRLGGLLKRRGGSGPH
jgi:hypothetical protein